MRTRLLAAKDFLWLIPASLLLGGLLASRVEKFEKDMEKGSRGRRGVLDDDDD